MNLSSSQKKTLRRIAHHLDVTPVPDAIRVLRAPDNAQS